MGSPGMWRRVFVRTGSCTAKVRTRRRRSGGGCRAGHPAPRARDRGAIRLPCPATGAAAGGSGVGSSPSSDEAARGYARRAAPVARDLRVRLSGRHARRRDPDCRVSVGRTAWRRGCVSSSFAKGRLCRSIEPSSAESRRDVGALEPFPNASTGGPTRNALPSSSAAAVLVRPSWIARHGEAAGVPGDRAVGRSRTGG